MFTTNSNIVKHQMATATTTTTTTSTNANASTVVSKSNPSNPSLTGQPNTAPDYAATNSTENIPIKCVKDRINVFESKNKSTTEPSPSFKMFTRTSNPNVQQKQPAPAQKTVQKPEQEHKESAGEACAVTHTVRLSNQQQFEEDEAFNHNQSHSYNHHHHHHHHQNRAQRGTSLESSRLIQMDDYEDEFVDTKLGGTTSREEGGKKYLNGSLDNLTQSGNSKEQIISIPIKYKDEYLSHHTSRYSDPALDVSTTILDEQDTPTKSLNMDEESHASMHVAWVMH